MARRRKGRAVSGVLFVDKPAGYSSNGVLQKVRWLYQAQKGGHTGALDPAATGLLPICLGEATKFTQFLLDANKRYVTTGLLGVETHTLDGEGNIVAQAEVPDITREDLEGIISQGFIGDIEQIPPMYSALKRDGVKLYELAREGKVLELEPRPVTIFANELIELNCPRFSLDVTCSKGTYIRTLVADIGAKVGCGAHVETLRRTEHGKFKLANAITLDALIGIQESGDIEKLDGLLLSIDELLAELPVVTLGDLHSRLFGNGNDVQCDLEPGRVRVYDFNGQFMGVGRISGKSRLQPERLISKADL